MARMSEDLYRIEAIIFDFDGTLADSAEVNLEATAEVLKRDPFTPEEIEVFRTLTAQETMKKLRIKKWQLPSLLLKGQRIARENMHRIPAFPGMPEAIDQLDKKGYDRYILSTNSLNNIHAFLGRNSLDDSITKVYGGADLFGKARRLSRLMRREGLLPAECVYVGDEQRDIEAAREAGIQCVAVTWGYQTAELLARHDPDGLAESPNELVDIIDSFARAAKGV